MEKNHPIPVDFMISEKTNVLVITGPNTGGKTISLKTVGLASLMAKTGNLFTELSFVFCVFFFSKCVDCCTHPITQLATIFDKLVAKKVKIELRGIIYQTILFYTCFFPR